jgi:diaminopimelate decarboxylase
MDHFIYKQGRLYCEDVPVSDIALSAGTPLYVYSAATLLHHYRAIEDAFAPLAPLICYSIKGLPNLHVLRLLKEAGSGFDVVSGGELSRALEAGADPARVAFAGVGKTDAEILAAVRARVGLFNVESEAEFENLSRIAAAEGRTIRAALRLNPDVHDPRTHSYTATGRKESKFGVDIERAQRFFQSYGRDANVRLDGLHLHIGSPIYSPDPYAQAISKAIELADRLRGMGFAVNLLDIGGGFAADYEEGKSPPASVYASAIVPLLRGKGLAVVIEPGRQISANAGVLLARVLYVKEGGQKRFVITDAAMTDLLRPALYGAEHFVYPAEPAAGVPSPRRRMNFAPPGAIRCDVVGGVCENSDFLAKDRMLPPVARGDLLAVFSAGAYGFSMASQYNTRPRSAEALVQGARWRIIRRRETYDDLVAAER